MKKSNNKDLADIFEEVAQGLLYQKEAWVKVKSYLNAAELLRELDEPIEQIARDGRLGDLPGVGKAISKKILKYLELGNFPLALRLRETIPAGIRDLMASGLAPSVVRHLEDIGVETLDQLELAIREGRVTLKTFPKRLQPTFRDFLVSRESQL